MGNAAVMGLFPRVRYILLTDLLLETMTDEQIEAVFAHELGHVVHRHLVWFTAFFALILVFMGGPGQFGLDHLKAWYLSHWSAQKWDQIEGLIAGCVAFGAFVLAFGYLSPKFERQADVYAARSIPGGPADEKTVVTERGAARIASALNRVAAINHIPTSARNWSHGSIATRVRAVCEMSGDPERTHRFDRFMNRHYIGLVALILTFGAWTCLSMRSSAGSSNPDAEKAGLVAPSHAAGVGR
jgi:STE24 endopeptidase